MTSLQPTSSSSSLAHPTRETPDKQLSSNTAPYPPPHLFVASPDLKCPLCGSSCHHHRAVQRIQFRFDIQYAFVSPVYSLNFCFNDSLMDTEVYIHIERTYVCICAHAKSVILFLNPAALLPKCVAREQPVESFDFISIRSTRFFVNSFAFYVLFCAPFFPCFTAIYSMSCLLYSADYFAYCAISFWNC